MDSALQELILNELDPDEIVEVLVRLTDDNVIPDKMIPISQFGDVVTCRIRRGDILEVYRSKLTKSMKAPRFIAYDGQLSLEYNYVPYPRKEPSFAKTTGKNTIVAVLDWGIDFAHPNFRNPDGSTRLLGIWDQSFKDSKGYAPYGYGRLFTRDQINRALKSRTPYRALRYHPGKSDSLGRGTHGTHVMDIAAGNGKIGNKGVAPEADLLFVHLASRGTSGTGNLGDSVRILEALDAVRNLAEDNSLVVNLSVGRHGGPHDGKTLVEQGIDNFLNNRDNTMVCQSTGNYYQALTHHSDIVRPGKIKKFSFIIDQADTTLNEMEIWYPGNDLFSFELINNRSGKSFTCPVNSRRDVILNGSTIGRIYHRDKEPNNGKNHINLFLFRNAPSGRWIVKLKGKKVFDGRYHAWIERDGGCRTCQSRFDPSFAVSNSTTGTIANGYNSIVCGAYDATSSSFKMASFSSKGPTLDGRFKPDIIAPGWNILAAKSTPVSSNLPRPSTTRMSGTSMAAPHVTGATALVLETLPENTPFWKIRNIIIGSADPVLGADASRVGSGKLNITKAVATAEQYRESTKRSRRVMASLSKRNTFRIPPMPDSAPIDSRLSTDAQSGNIRDEWPRSFSNPRFQRLYTPASWTMEKSVEAMGRPDLNISAKVLSSYDYVLNDKYGSRKKFKSKILEFSKWIELSPGIVAVNLISETNYLVYLSTEKVDSYIVGVDDYYDDRNRIKAKVGTKADEVKWDRKQTPSTNPNEKGRIVKTIFFDSGEQALKASIVYLKYREIVLQEFSISLGSDFSKYSKEVRFCLMRLAFNAGLGRAKTELKRFVKEAKSPLIVRETGGPQRKATIKAAQAVHMDKTILKPSIDAEKLNGAFDEPLTDSLLLIAKQGVPLKNEFNDTWIKASNYESARNANDTFSNPTGLSLESPFFSPSYLSKIFVVNDSNAILRDENLIPLRVRIVTNDIGINSVGNAILVREKGYRILSILKASSGNIIAQVATKMHPMVPLGWTVASNFFGSLYNESLTLRPAPAAISSDPSAFTIADSKAIVRNPNTNFSKTGTVIPIGSFVQLLRYDQSRKYAQVILKKSQGSSPTNNLPLWTAIDNLVQGWIQILGANSAWRQNKFIGMIDLVDIIGTRLGIKQVSSSMLNAYQTLTSNALAQGIQITLNSGFRSYPDQARLYINYKKGIKGYNLAAPPGRSNHQNGIAFDLNTKGKKGAGWGIVYNWLKQYATSFGFLRTVRTEHWHWEYNPNRAAHAKQIGEYRSWMIMKNAEQVHPELEDMPIHLEVIKGGEHQDPYNGREIEHGDVTNTLEDHNRQLHQNLVQNDIQSTNIDAEIEDDIFELHDSFQNEFDDESYFDTISVEDVKNVGKAVRANRRYGISLGWNVYHDKINDLLLPFTGMQNVSLSEETFAFALSKWQKSKGISEVDSDGILGPKTWRIMKGEIGITATPLANTPVTLATVEDEWNNLQNIKVKYPSLQSYLVKREEVARWGVPNPGLYIAAAISEWNENSKVHHYFGSFDGNPRKSYLNLKRLYNKKGISNPAEYISTNIRRYTFFNKSSPGHIVLKQKLASAEQKLKAAGHTFSFQSAWSFVPRTFNSNINKLSNHAIGKAVDIDPQSNPHITNKGEMKVIEAVCGSILVNGFLRERDPDVFRRASDHFKTTFNSQWVSQQTDQSILSVLRSTKRMKKLEKYARLGFCTLPGPLVRALQNAGLSWGGAWSITKDFMHFETN